nr:MAG TPA: hypothetical protein [Caudoviricetes sp.]
MRNLYIPTLSSTMKRAETVILLHREVKIRYFFSFFILFYYR